MRGETDCSGRRKRVRSAVMAAGALMVVLSVAAVAVAHFVIVACIGGNTVNYSVFGAEPDSEYTVVIEHDGTHQSNQYKEQSDENGEFSGSGTPGNSKINPGDSVTVGVYDSEGNLVGSTTVTKDPPLIPWWAYTGVGTLFWLLDSPDSAGQNKL